MMPFFMVNPPLMEAEARLAANKEIREYSKLEGNLLEGDEAQTSQPSTIGSLGNVEEQRTSVPSKMQQLEKLGMEIGQKIRKGTQSQVNNIRSMILRVFGEKVDPSRDNDQTTRQVLKAVNEEIRKLPKRGEQVSEGEGQGPIMQSLPQGHTLVAINEVRDRIAHQMPQMKKEFNDIASVAKHQLGQIKQKFVQNFGEKVNPAKDLDPGMKDKLTKLNEDIRKLPRRDERVIESEGTATEMKQTSWEGPDIGGYWF